jgi:hypothetical protein
LGSSFSKKLEEKFSIFELQNMPQNQSLFIILIILLLDIIIIGGGAMYFYLSQSPQPSLPTCPLDFKTCPDGSKVYRLPPDCQFPQCPSLSETEKPQPQDETANWKVYRNEKYKFEVKYPEDWKIVDLGSGFTITPKNKRLPEDVFITVLATLKEDSDIKKTPQELNVNYKTIGENKFIFTSNLPDCNYPDTCIREDSYSIERNEYAYLILFKVGGFPENAKQRGAKYLSDLELEYELNILHNLLSTFRFIE